MADTGTGNAVDNGQPSDRANDLANYQAVKADQAAADNASARTKKATLGTSVTMTGPSKAKNGNVIGSKKGK